MTSPARMRSRTAKLATLCALCGALAIAWKFRRPIKHAFDPKPPAPPLRWVDNIAAVKIDSGKRSNVFYEKEPISFKLDKSAARWEVRDYSANIVDSGGAGERIQVKAQPPGWYKLYVYGAEDRGGVFGKVIGGTMFCVFRRDARFPDLPSRDVPNGSDAANDEPMRGVIGMGPQRLRVEDAAKPDEAIAKIEKDVALDRKYYLPFDPIRQRALLCAFPNGTRGKEDGVRKIVAHFKHDIRFWEPRNEPNGGASGRDFAVNEMKPFHDAVKSVDAKLQVIGPGTVSLNPDMQNWLDDFFAAGGGKSIDAFSFHAYNNVNGDVWLARRALTTTNTLLKKYGLQNLPKWQTEQGNAAAIYGVYTPAHQARWTMTQMMVFEQFGIPKERNHLWYDRSHGFWDNPAWWVNDDGSLNPEAVTMRVWSEELFGKTFNRVLDFGSANALVLGSEFKGKEGALWALMSTGATDAKVQLKVSSGQKLRVVSSWGVARDIAVVNGVASLVVPELPLYVEPKNGQTLQVVPQNWGENLARQSGVTIAASQLGDTSANNDIRKVINGEMENWYWTFKPETTPWNAFDPTLPMTVDIQLPKVQTVNRVLVFAAPPWQLQSSLLDFDVQIAQNANAQNVVWKTVAQVKEPTRTWNVWTPPTRTSVDSFFSDRWIFPTSFAPVQTDKIRLLIRDATFGGGANELVAQAGGQSWGKKVVMLREVEVYGK